MMEYDAVVVGTGVAGCFAALHLPKDQKILMITKADLEESDSFLAQGGICMLRDDSDYESYYEDTMRAGHYENSPESVEVMIRSSGEVIRELIAYGIDFEKEDGHLAFTREGAHSAKRILYHKDETGKEITKKLLDAVKRQKNITIMTHTAMKDILCREGICEGIVMEKETGDLVPVFAENVIWACGGIGGIYEHSTNFPHLTGDALAVALRRNIALKNINYVQIHPTTLYSEGGGRSFLISESVRGEGAVLYNKNMERFVDELQPRDVVAQAIFRQMREDGTNHVWLSFLTIQDLDVRQRFPHIYERCLEEGYDITRECIPVVPAQHYFMGGVEVDLDGRTTMKNLYAAGETSCNGVHGANRLASNSLLESLVFAKRAAQQIAKDKRGCKERPRRPETLEELTEKYCINWNIYKDREQYQKQNEEMIWKAMREEEENGCDYKKVKCG